MIVGYRIQGGEAQAEQLPLEAPLPHADLVEQASGIPLVEGVPPLLFFSVLGVGDGWIGQG